ncbi:protein CREG1 [Diachasma alloeum]|uniref:protein CREG1 n=1 Tax=Diachasma alloeum TaxID=454923 RepID=UPI0007383A63|nr:protein CREG1 [Diachasma alloeum]
MCGSFMTCSNYSVAFCCSRTMARLWLFLSVISIFSAAVSPAIGNKRSSRRYWGAEEHEWREFEEFKEWKRLKNWERKNHDDRVFGEGREERVSMPRTPPREPHPAVMARFIVNQANWSSVATISTRKDIPSFPFAGVISVSDGPIGNGSGIPYMYLTPLDFTAQDLAKDHRATLMMTLAQGSWCKQKLMDPMDPRCARVGLSGRIKEVFPRDRDYDIAKNAVFGRHPWLSHMPPDHHFFFAKLDILSIAMLDAFGGPKYIPVTEYLNATSFQDNKQNEMKLVPRRSVYVI